MNHLDFDFDRVYPRRQSDSVKWNRFPEDVLPLWVADMDFAAPAGAVRAVEERLAHPLFGYAREDDELRGLICEWLARRHNWVVEPDHILFMDGVVSGLNWVAQTFLRPGEGMAFQTPVYPPFFKVTAYADCPCVEIPLVAGEDGYRIDFDLFENRLEERTRLFILCNPHNPVGRVFTRAELEKIGEICLRKDILICSDEIHCDLTFSRQRHIPLASLSPELASRTVTLMAPSKTFNIPGLNHAFAVVSNPELRGKLQKGRRGVVGAPGLLAGAAARGAYRSGENWLDALLVYLEGNRDFLMAYLTEKIPAIRAFPPQGTYLAWLDCRDLIKDQNPGAFFLEKARVALNNGLDFGREGEGFARLNFGCPRSILAQALERMSAAVKSA